MKEWHLPAYSGQEGGGPLVAPREEYDETGDSCHQQQADHGDEHVPRLEPVQRQRHQQRQPEDDVEHHGRAQALGSQGHRGVGSADA